MNLVFLNKFYPPGKAITGDNLKILVDYISNTTDYNPIVVSIDSSYKGIESDRDLGTKNQIKLKPILSNNQNKIIRLMVSIIDSYRMMKKAKSLQPDTIVYMTDPPFLSLFANLIGFEKHVRKVYWTMDLYPEAFHSAGLSSTSNPIYKWIHKKVYANPPQALIALGDIQLKYLISQYQLDSIHRFVYPCGITSPNLEVNIPSWKNDDEIVFGYCGNLGEAHSIEFLKIFLDNFPYDQYKFILSVYGAKANQVLTNIKPYKNLIILPSVPKNELKYIDVHLVSLVPEWTNVCVPSKAVSAVCMESTIIYCGIEQSDNWGLLSDAGWLIDYYSDYTTQIHDFFNTFSIEVLKQKKQNAYSISEKLNKIEEESLREITNYIIEK